MKTKIAVAAVLLICTMPFAYGMGPSSSGSPGASQLSPGHEMRSGTDRDDRGPGASGFSPGREKSGTIGQSRGGRGDSDTGASEFAPGNRMPEGGTIDRR